MVKVERSIEVNMPVSVVYRELLQFEEFPRFMKGVHSVHQLDDAHLHWRAEKDGQEMEWDAEITEQIPERCIAWRNTTGPRNEGRVVLAALEPEKTRISLSMEAEEGALIHPESKDDFTPQDEGDLARFKKMLESKARSSGTDVDDAKGAPPRRRLQEWTPPVDIEQHAGNLHICADLPGVNKQDVQIEIVHNRLTIEGERRGGVGGRPTGHRHAECNYGHFYRMITLPAGVDPDSAQASMHDGVLDITLRMAAAADSARRLDIQGG